jgi:hypothetical protein
MQTTHYDNLIDAAAAQNAREWSWGDLDGDGDGFRVAVDRPRAGRIRNAGEEPLRAFCPPRHRRPLAEAHLCRRKALRSTAVDEHRPIWPVTNFGGGPVTRVSV